MEKVLVVTHIDPDGILSARLLQLVYGANGIDVDVVFCDWRHYGIPEAIFEEEYLEQYSNVYVCDIALESDVIERESALSDILDICITHIDHHPANVIFLDARTVIVGNGESHSLELAEKFRIIHSLENCATGLVYDYIINSPGKDFADVNKWLQIWALVGIFADVATGTEGGKRIVNEIRNEQPDLLGKYYKSGITAPISTMIGRFLNNPRRIAFNYGPRVSLNACKEIEDLGDFSVLFSEKLEIDARAPNAALLRNWNKLYTAEMEAFDKKKDHMIIDFITHGYVIFSHRWNIGSSLASSLSRRFKKPFTAINMGLSSIIANGRTAVKTSKMSDLGVVYKDAVANSKYGLQGGGHPKAAACAFKKEMTSLEVIHVLEKSFRKYRK